VERRQWHRSWIYTTSQVLVALLGTPSRHHPAIRRATRVLLAEQRGDGGWGTDADGVTRSNSEETAFGVLGLRAVVRHGVADRETLAALRRGERWMQAAYRTSDDRDDRRWLGKESYRPRRIVRMFELAAALPSAEIPSDPRLRANPGRRGREPSLPRARRSCSGRTGRTLSRWQTINRAVDIVSGRLART
jgi:hypothetical protein